MSSPSGTVSLSQGLDEYLATRFISNKRDYVNWLIIAKQAWRDIFWNTIYSVQAEWQTLKTGLPFNYIDVPRGAARIFSVSIEDYHHNLKNLYYNSQVNILVKPTPDCGCKTCGSDICDDLNTLTVTSKLEFVINGIQYFSKQWVKVCKNGDILKWNEIPVKDYNSYAGDSGDFNGDFNNDWSKGNPGGGDWKITYRTNEERICNIPVKPCGCPVETPEVLQTINDTCGCYFPSGRWARFDHQKTFQDEVNSHGYGTIKMSECGTKIYFIPDRNCGVTYPTPNQLMVSWQGNGSDCTEQVQVPEYALDAWWANIHWRSMRFNGAFSPGEKLEAKYAKNDAENNLILFLNPIDLQRLSQTQDMPIKF